MECTKGNESSRTAVIQVDECLHCFLSRAAHVWGQVRRKTGGDKVSSADIYQAGAHLILDAATGIAQTFPDKTDFERELDLATGIFLQAGKGRLDEMAPPQSGEAIH